MTHLLLFSQENAEYYIKVMKKIQEKGLKFVTEERQRLKKLINSGKISEEKKKEQEARLNVVTQFRQSDNDWTVL
jgi:3-hydroxyacyl-CoA dehydrogenase